ncbi:putative transcriptional regulator, containings HTH domain [Nostoc flagelliforme CCNUN1]|uniref:Putative transcriptional regulator, containings HTH domain n=1 Tax=Nostoc flagelliforme CCNUN1 TaxID=2038116 RepID=A0A2K8STR8_9NOSO|nr:ATP-binding protein [Nostoc flagelliforme]AUB38846.1 putative transcriptional regulator, containings HTH domain [Nostoc flagelliforme CCNUN1]
MSSSNKQNKSWKEDFAQFFESPSRETLRELLRNPTGEYDDLDFKSELVPDDEIAKNILGMANKSGGAIIFGVEEKKEDNSFNSKGLSDLNDKTEFKNKVEKYLPSQLNFDVIDFLYEESEYPKLKGKLFRVVIIEYNPRYIPFLPKKDSDKIKRYHIFIRHNTSTIAAEYEHLQDILNRRVETTYSSTTEMSLAEHLAQLKELYSMIQKNKPGSPGSVLALNFWENTYFTQKNPYYPEEEYDAFISRMIFVKKQVIEAIIQRKESL